MTALIMSPLRLLVAPLALLVVAGGAAAQACPGNLSESWSWNFEDVDPDEQATPGGGPRILPFSLTYSCTGAAASAPQVPQAQVSLETDAAWAWAGVEPSSFALEWDPNVCPPDGERTLHGNFTVGFNADAPAFKDTQFVARVTVAEGSGCYSDDASRTFSLKPAFVGGFTATLDRTFYKTGPNRQITVPLEARNDANGAVKAFFDIVAFPPSDHPEGLPSSRQFQVITPVPVTLDSVHGGKTTERVVPIHLNSPYPRNGDIDETWAFQVTVSARSVDKTVIELEPQVVNFSVRVVGTYFSGPDLPGFAAPGLAFAAAAAVALRRRR